MDGEIERGPIEGRVLTDGIAQSVTREDGVVWIRLSFVPGHPAPPAHGGLTKVKFPEPVTVEAGEWVAVEMGWLPDADRVAAGQPMHMPTAATLTKAAAGLSAVLPGTTQGAVG